MFHPLHGVCYPMILLEKKSFQTMSLEPLLKGNGRAPGAVKEILEITETHKVFLVKSHHNMAWGQRSWQKLCTSCEGATFYLCLADLFFNNASPWATESILPDLTIV